jgi:hypothetical protein
LRNPEDDVADLDAEGPDVGGVLDPLVDADLDVVPGDGLQVDLGVERVAAGLQRQDRAGVVDARLVGEHAHPRALGEPRRPGADRDDPQPPVRLDRLHHAADRVRVDDHGALEVGLLAPQRRVQHPPPGQPHRQAEGLGLLAEHPHDLVGAPGGARLAQQAQQEVDHVVAVDGEQLGVVHAAPPRSSGPPPAGGCAGTTGR